MCGSSWKEPWQARSPHRRCRLRPPAHLHPFGRSQPGGLALATVSAVVTALIVWNLRAPEVRSIVRFEYELPESHQFRNTQRSVIAFSSDGRHFAYNTPDGLYLRALGELAARLIPGTAQAMSNPFFSPAGDWLGYWSVGDAQLKKVPTSGGAAVTLCRAENPAPPQTVLQPASVTGRDAGGG